jgi:MULE transposase domain/MuDR family transposase
MSEILAVGTEWDSVDALKHAVIKYAIENRFPTKIQRRNAEQFDIRCKNDGCSWRLYASKYDSACFVVKIFVNEHFNCPGARMENSAADSHFIANVIAAKVKEKPDYAPHEIRQDINRDHRVQVSYWKAHRAKTKANNDINGTPEEGYAKLRQYCDKLRESNPGSVVILETTSTAADGEKFRRLFIAYAASLDGFIHCRPVLGLDGTHLTSKYGGILLAATAVDARDNLFPLAFAVVSAENDINWDWFLNNLSNALDNHLPTSIQASNEIAFLSDRQKGLREAVETRFPGAAHAYCMRHLVDNFTKHFKHKDLIQLLWKAARATTQPEFEEHCSAMRAINTQCVAWLFNNAHPRHWATVYFNGRRYGHFTSNISESLNSWLLHARDMPIQSMLETIREKTMHWFAERREFAAKHADNYLVPEVYPDSLFQCVKLIFEDSANNRWIKQ